MWRYYLLRGTEVLFRTDDRKQAVEKANELCWAGGTGANPVVLTRSVFRNQLVVEKRTDI